MGFGRTGQGISLLRWLFPKRCLPVRLFAVGYVEHAFALPDCAATKLFHVLGKMTS